MTYCLAWKDKNEIYIAGESLITGNNQYTTNIRSSFGEHYNNVNSKEDGVEENAIKINQISNKLFLAYAGDVSEAIEVSNMLKEAIEVYELTIELALQNVLKNSSPCKETELILGYYTKDNEAKLISYINGVIKETEFVEIGSGIENKNLTLGISNFLNFMKNESNYFGEPEKKLTTFLAVCQFYTTGINLIDKGVGGIFYGAYLNKNGIFWAEDTSYYYYRDNIYNSSFTTILRRDNLYFVNSSYSQAPVVLYNNFYLNELSYLIRSNRLQSICDEVNEAKTKYFVFFSHEKNKIIVLNINYQLKNILFSLWVQQNEKSFNYNFGFNPIFAESLNKIESEILIEWVTPPTLDENISFEEFVSSRNDFYSLQEQKKLKIIERLSNFLYDKNGEIIPVIIDVDFFNNEIEKHIDYYTRNKVFLKKIQIDNLIKNILEHMRIDRTNKNIKLIFFGKNSYILNSDVELLELTVAENLIYFDIKDSEETSSILLDTFRVAGSKKSINTFVICVGLGNYYYGIDNLSSIYDIRAVKSRDDHANWVYERINYQFIDYILDDTLGITKLQQQGIFRE